MLIVNDIQDAITMKTKLASVLRRSKTFGKDTDALELELEMIVGDLMDNIDRIEASMIKESFAGWGS
tara:strand:- start:658 stop:858 length:201 start_codon:yes stop_codon:yes gene_type:complete